MALFIPFGLFLLALLTYIIFKSKKSKRKPNGYFISTESLSKGRVKELELDMPSEDASYILQSAKLSFPDTTREIRNEVYGADPAMEWIVNLNYANGTVFKEDLRWNWRVFLI